MWQSTFSHIGAEETLGAFSENLRGDRKSTRLNSSHVRISYAVFCLNKKKASDVADIRELRASRSTMELLQRSQITMSTSCIRHSAFLQSPVTRVALYR